MTEVRHGKLTTEQGIHIPYQWVYADAATRDAASGFSDADLGKLAYIEDSKSLWMLTGVLPIEWTAVGGSTQIAGRDVSLDAPSDGQALLWSELYEVWKPSDIVISLDNQLVAIAEFTNAVLDAGSGSSNSGTLTAHFDSTNRRNYYNWTTEEATTQSYDVVWQFRVPLNFSSWSSGLKMTSMVDNATGNSGVRLVEFLDGSGTNAIVAATKQNTTWIEDEFSISGGSFSAGDLCTVRVRLFADTSENARLHSLRLTYNSGV